MRTRGCVIFLFCFCVSLATAQDTLRTSGPTLLTKDTSKVQSVLIASMSTYPVGFDRIGAQTGHDSLAQDDPAPQGVVEPLAGSDLKNEPAQSSERDVPAEESAEPARGSDTPIQGVNAKRSIIQARPIDPGPIRDWSNPPGYMGSVRHVKTVRISPFKAGGKRNHRKVSCASFR